MSIPKLTVEDILKFIQEESISEDQAQEIITRLSQNKVLTASAVSRGALYAYGIPFVKVLINGTESDDYVFVKTGRTEKGIFQRSYAQEVTSFPWPWDEEILKPDDTIKRNKKTSVRNDDFIQWLRDHDTEHTYLYAIQDDISFEKPICEALGVTPKASAPVIHSYLQYKNNGMKEAVVMKKSHFSYLRKLFLKDMLPSITNGLLLLISLLCRSDVLATNLTTISILAPSQSKPLQWYTSQNKKQNDELFQQFGTVNLNEAFKTVQTLFGKRKWALPARFMCTADRLVKLSLSKVTLKKIEDNVFTGNHTLVTIIMNGLDALTKIGDNFAKGCKNLTKVSLTGCPNISKIGNHFVEGCKALTELDVDFTSIATIGNNYAKSCTALTDINLKNCNLLTTIGDNFAQKCTNLTILVVHNCPNLTSIGMAFGEDCKKLESLALSNCGTKIDSCMIEPGFGKNTKARVVDITGLPKDIPTSHLKGVQDEWLVYKDSESAFLPHNAQGKWYPNDPENPKNLKKVKQ
eukprot:PhF_6_TR10474/c0_g1_i1/m.16555